MTSRYGQSGDPFLTERGTRSPSERGVSAGTLRGGSFYARDPRHDHEGYFCLSTFARKAK
eukprot:1273273-Rhodomonas_salina.1